MVTAALDSLRRERQHGRSLRRRPGLQPAVLVAVSASVAAAIVLVLGTGHGRTGRHPPGDLVAAGVRDGALALGTDGAPAVAYVSGRTLFVARLRGHAWRAQAAATLERAPGYRLQLVLDPKGAATVLVQDRPGRWVGVASERAGSWSWSLVARARARGSTFGPAGVALDATLRPVVAATTWAGRASFLRLFQLERGKFAATGITRQGFPSSATAPAAAPVVLPNREVHVVETFGAQNSVQGVEWGHERDGWWGQGLEAAAFAEAVGPVRALVDRRGTLWSAWTAVGFGQTFVVLAARTGTIERSTLFSSSSLAALALGPEGPEVAVNSGTTARIVQAGRLPVNVSGTVADFAVTADGRREVLLSRDGGLYLYRAPLGRLIDPGRQTAI